MHHFRVFLEILVQFDTLNKRVQLEQLASISQLNRKMICIDYVTVLVSYIPLEHLCECILERVVIAQLTSKYVTIELNQIPLSACFLFELF